MIEDYIRIKGDSTDPSPYQGTTAVTGDTGGGGGEVGTLDVSVTDAMWMAQNATIDEQTERLTWLRERLGEDAAGNTGITGLLKDLGSWFLQEATEQALGEYIEHQFLVFDLAGEIGDDLADWISSAIVNGAVWLIDFFEKKAAPGVKQCNSMIAENDSIRSLEKSVGNYDLRRRVLDEHQKVIEHLESQLIEADGVMFNVVKTVIDLVKAFANGSSSDDDDDGWDDVLASIGTETGKIQTWLNEMETKDEENLPVPSPPTLPAPPEGTKGAKLRVAYMLAKFGFTLYTQIMKKQRETDTHITDLVQAVEDLKFNGQRIHLPNGDVMELTGIGTVAATYNS